MLVNGSPQRDIPNRMKAMKGVSARLLMKEFDLPDDNKEAVYERMISERDNIAATYTAEGDSEAEKQAEILRAEGEQEYMRILAEAYGEEEQMEFYSFVRSLDALKKSMTGESKTVILSETSPIAQLFER